MAVAAAILAAPTPLLAQDRPVETVTVVAGAPAPGSGIDVDKLPSHIQSLGAANLRAEGSASLTAALEDQMGGVSINDNLDDPFQPDIQYRGFTASPVLGAPEGLAVYQNGVRVNEAFGDSLNWDLIPDMAVNRVTLVSANPVYGLNALGGAVVIDMKTGFTYQGGELELSGGSWGQRGAAAQYGVHTGELGLYVAGRLVDQDGWRAFSPDRVRQAYIDLSYHSARATLDLSVAGADNGLSGQSAAPVQELAVSRSLVFTSPQSNTNRLGFVTLNAGYALNDELSLQATAYVRNYRQRVVNGNTTNVTACAAGPYLGDLCQADGATPLTDDRGAILPDISRGGLAPIGENDVEHIHSVSQGVSLQVTDAADLGRWRNHLTLGGELDEARTRFSSSAEIGVINSALQVERSGLFIDTPEQTPWTATPVSLAASTRHLGLFATDTLNLTPAFALTVSARYNDARIDLADRRGQALSGRNHFSRLNPAIGFSDRLTAAVTAYTGYAEGGRTPTPSEIECANPAAPCLLPSSLSSDPPTLKQVISRTWEAGLRGRFAARPGGAGQVAWAAGLFRTDLDDDIQGVSTSLSTGYFQNIGGTLRQGAELSLTYQSPRLSLNFSYSYVAATYRASFLLNSPQNPHADSRGDIQVRVGDVLPGVPAHRFKIGGDYQVRPGWVVGADLVYESQQYFRGDESNQMKPLPDFAVLNLHGRYDLNARIAVFVNLVNALDARYANFGLLGDPTGIGAPGIPAGASTNGAGVDNRFESPAPPISFFAGARIRF